MSQLVLTGNNLSLADLERFLDGNMEVAASAEARDRVAACAAYCMDLADGEDRYYGINTGFGKFARTHIGAADAGRLQHNLLRSHATGMGEPLSADIVRLMLVLRVNSLLLGHSGVSLELIDLMLGLINRGVVPYVPRYGSVGASGDLAPLAHMALPLIGEGEVLDGEERLSAGEALSRAGLEPVALRPKEGLALINGTQMMSAYAVSELLRARRFLKGSMLSGGMALEACQATDRVFDPRLHALKTHPGQSQVAAGFRSIVAESEIIASHRECDRVQDPYSFRCSPQVLGAVVDTMMWVEEWVVREINAVTDNPVIIPDDGDVISGGNFHGQHMAIALDALGVAVGEVASLAERRINNMIDSDCDKLPKCLIPEPGLNSGLMITQYLAAALVSENKVHAHPASVDTIPTSLGFEDHVSMGSLSALKLARIVDNVGRVVAIELLCGAQALDFHKPLSPGRGTRVAYAAVREGVPFLTEDTVLSGYLETLERWVADGSIVRAVETVLGDLLPAG